MAGISKAERARRAAAAAPDDAGPAAEPAGADAAPDPATAGLVRMQRDPRAYPPPHAADVHPHEVDGFRCGGWVLAN